MFRIFALIAVLIGSCECVQACDYGTDQPIFSQTLPVECYTQPEVQYYTQRVVVAQPVYVQRVVEPQCYSAQQNCFDEFRDRPRPELYDRGRSSFSRGRGRDSFSFQDRGGFEFERDRRSFSEGGRERGGLLGGLRGGRDRGARFEDERVFVSAR